MKSNRHTLPICTQFSVFHDSARHHVDIDIDGEIVYQNNFTPGVKHHVRLNESFDFKKSSTKKITLVWRGDQETQDKYLMFDKWVINSQCLSAYQCMYVPDENEYSRHIKQYGTPEEKRTLQKQIMFGGNRFGWFGKMIWNFMLGNTLEVKKTLFKNKSEPILNVKWHKILLDEEEAKLFDRVQKKN